MYTWKDMIPLTCKEAHAAFKKGLTVLCLHPTQSQIAKSLADIKRHASKGGVFATDRDALLCKETYFIAKYSVFYGPNQPLRFAVSKKCATRDEAMDGCKAFLAQSLREHGIKEDGQYWAEFDLDRYVMGEYDTMTDFDEGFITVKDQAVTDVPCGFWLPF